MALSRLSEAIVVVDVPIRIGLFHEIERWARAADLSPEELAGALVALGADAVRRLAEVAEQCPVVILDASALEVSP